MDTMKSMFSGLAKKNMLYWLLERLHLVQPTPNQGVSTPKKLVEELDIDVRRILADHGIIMRASQPHGIKWYAPRGQYDWCFSDGGPVCYLYNVDKAMQEKIAEILQAYTIKENGTIVHPIWKVLTEKNMDLTIDDYTGQRFHLKKGNFDAQYDHVWPSVMIFLRPHYMVPFYNDHVWLGLTPLRITMKIPGFIDLRTCMGAHGTYSEHNVPLILVTLSETGVPAGTTIEKQVSVLDIIPTINALNGWPRQQTFEGKPLFLSQKTGDRSKKKVMVAVKNVFMKTG